MQHRKSAISQGFTIVELLIVIVIIAILAAITVVAFNGVTNRANDTAIQSDLNSFSKQVALYAAGGDGSYPVGGATVSGGSTTGNSTTVLNFTFAPTKTAYKTDSSTNLYYCTGVLTSTGDVIYRVAARSKSGNAFRYSSTAGLESLGATAIGSSTVCSGMSEPYTWGYGYYHVTNTWWPSWIK